ncbi:MAG TPA: hypothetical protein ENK31_01860 [Nannocystis exedens]|nr:hypothetical protein [Nannocystis exedens]
MLLVNARQHRPRWCLPPSLLVHIEHALKTARARLKTRLPGDLEHHARLVRAGQASPTELLARLQVLLAA